MLAPNYLNYPSYPLSWAFGGMCRKIARYLQVDSTIGWLPAAEKACSSLTSKDVDVILATAPPFSTFSLAKRLSDRLGCPYVMDYRDLWSRNAHDPIPAATRKEGDLLASCAAVTTVSPFWASVMDHEFGVGNKLHVITNGWDPEEITEVVPRAFGHFAIVYAGIFYPPKRVISPIMAALRQLRSEQPTALPEWYFHYYGGQDDHVREEADRFQVTERVVVHGKVSRTEALSAVAGAGLTVIITSVGETDSDEDRGIVTGKIFETVGLRSRFLLIAPHNSDARKVAESTGLGTSFTGGDIHGVTSLLRTVMLQPTTPTAPPDTDYQWKSIAERVNKVLHLTL
jgi:hypothetical protein